MNYNKRLKKNINACINNECDKCSKNELSCINILLKDALERIEKLEKKNKKLKEENMFNITAYVDRFQRPASH